MFPITSPRDLYEEYEARATKAVQTAQYASEAEPRPGRLAALLARFEAWLTARRVYPARYEVDEGGHLA